MGPDGKKLVPEDLRVRSQEAWRAASLFALLTLAAYGVVLATSYREMPPSLRRMFVVLAAQALGAVAILAACRRLLRRRLFVGIALSLALPTLVAIPYAASEWARTNRPLEVFWSLHLCMMACPLVVPGSFGLGLALTLALLLEVPLLVVLEHRMGVPLAQLWTEPTTSIVYAIVAVSLLWLARRRRVLVLAHLRTQVEVRALHPLSTALVAVHQKLEALLTSYRATMAALEGRRSSRLSKAMNGATDRLGEIRDRVAELRPGAAETRSAPAPSQPTVSPSEQHFFDRDAHNGALTFASIATLGASAGWVTLGGQSLHTAAPGWGLYALLGLVVLGDLLRTRSRPSSRRALVYCLILLVSGLTAELHTNAILIGAVSVPFEPLVAGKVFMVLVPLVLRRHTWLALVLEGVLLLERFAAYHHLGLADQRHLIPLVEPWSSFLFAGVGALLVQQREQRQAASVRLLRAQAELAALTRRATVSLALRDQINSPLQSLQFAVGLLRAKHVASAMRLDQFSNEISTLTSELAAIDALSRHRSGRLTFAGDAVLKRRGP